MPHTIKEENWYHKVLRDRKVMGDWHLKKKKMKNFENNVKNCSASERESRTSESQAIINPAGSVSGLRSIQNTTR